MFGDNRYHGPQQLDPNEDEIDVVGQPDEGNYNTVRIPGHSGPFLTGKVRDIHMDSTWNILRNTFTNGTHVLAASLQ